MISRLILTLTLCLAGPAAFAAPGEQPAPALQPTPAEQLDRLFDEYWEAWLVLNPLSATFIGDHRYDDRLAIDIAPGYREASRALYGNSLDAVAAIPAEDLDPDRRLSRELFVREMEEQLDAYRFPDHLQPVNQFRNLANTFAMLGSGSSAQPFTTVADYENFLGRVEDFSAWVDQAIANMRLGMQVGVVQPAILMERTIPQLEAHIVDEPAESMFHWPAENFPVDMSGDDRARLKKAYEHAIAGTIVPAYTRLRDFIRDEYLPECRHTDGYWALPDGEAWYEFLVRQHTTTATDPLEIHRIGLAEVERIHDEMRAVMKEVGFEGDLQAFFDHLNTAPEFYFDSREAIVAAHEALRERADRAAPRLFERIPKAGYEIRAVEEFRERSAAKGSYQRPSADGSRPGIFYANTWNPTTRPKWDIEALFLHEAVPGHHFQRAFNLELDDLPAFRRYGGITAFAEGWGLYAESIPVGRAMGFYDDPYQRFGELNSELWRAIRLVVDTGLHAKRWTREEVLAYMYANSASLETRAVSEAERFMAIPGQALAYKMGQLRITGLRNRAEEMLGDDFDIRAFHDEVLGAGDLPLEVLERRIDAWIASAIQ